MGAKGPPCVHPTLAQFDEVCLQLIAFVFGVQQQEQSQWRFTGPDGEEAVLISGRLKANNGNFLRVAVIKGEGIGLAPTFLVGEDLTAGRLVPLMPDYTPVESDLTVVYPHRRQLSAKVRSFVDFLAARFAGEPEWDRWRDQTRSREARRIDK